MEKKLTFFKNNFIITMILFSLFVTSCCHNKDPFLPLSTRCHCSMNHENFCKIQEGSCFKFVIKKFGEPTTMVLLREGIKEYHYVRRAPVAPGVMDHVHFIFTVSCDGLIINKTVETLTSTKELCF